MNLRRVLLVAAGGSVGTAARLGLGMLLPDDGGFPSAILAANVIGALLLGILTARLPDATELRLLLGTGMLGGFTTYSSLMTGSVTLWSHAPVLAGLYLVGTLVLGLVAAALGLRMGRPRHARAVER